MNEMEKSMFDFFRYKWFKAWFDFPQLETVDSDGPEAEVMWLDSNMD